MQQEPDGLIAEIILTPEGRDDPYPRYRALRERAPVHASMMGATFLSRYEDCHLALRAPQCGKPSAEWRETFPQPDGMLGGSSGGLDPEQNPMGEAMIMLNPPDHTRIRGLVSRAFTPRRVASLEPAIERMIDDLLDPIAERGEAEIMSDLAFRLPVAVIGELVGVPEPDRDQFRSLTRTAAQLIEPGTSPEQVTDALAATEVMRAYFAELIAARRAEPQDDLVSALIAARDGEDRLTESELMSTIGIIFLAGFETTTNLIGNGLYALLTEPGAMEQLRADRSLDDTAVDELLRWDSPVQLDLRVTFEDLELPGGEVIDAGTRLITLLGAANHDPAAFDDPDALDLRRPGGHILSFAVGEHYCIGASLARAEGRIVFRRLLDRFSSIELADPAPPRQTSFTLRGFSELPVAVEV